MSVPRHAGEMTAVLDGIDGVLGAGRTVNVGCWRGWAAPGPWSAAGRSATSTPATGPIEQIAERWQRVEKSWRVLRSPRTDEQRDCLRNWVEPR